MDVAETRVSPTDLVLDPFSYVPDMTSKIDGLGGDARGPDGDYAFHTPYVEAAEGVTHFSIHFEGLTATQGTLNLRVHMLSPDSPHARLAAAERIALNRLVLIGGHHEIRFEAFHGVTYALYGGIIGDTDAVARSLRVILDRPADPNERRDVAAEARNTAFGSDAVPVSHVISLRPPSLASPVTQVATARQLKESVAARWRKAGARGRSGDLDQWCVTYLLEALKGYGMMQPNARGVALGHRDGSVAALLGREGVHVEVILPPETQDREAILHGLRDGGGADGASSGVNVTVRSASLSPLAPDIVNFDFLWSDRTVGEDLSVKDRVPLIEAAMACLRPAGLAVHIVDYDIDGVGAGRALERQDVERLILLLISRGHDVGEFRIEADGALRDERGLSACGIVCRKAPLRA